MSMRRESLDIGREERAKAKRRHTLMAILFILALTGAKAMVFVYVSNDVAANNDSIIESNTQELASTIDLYNLRHPEKADSKIIVNTDLIGGNRRVAPVLVVTPTVDGDQMGNVNTRKSATFIVEGTPSNYTIRAYDKNTGSYETEGEALVYNKGTGFANLAPEE